MRSDGAARSNRVGCRQAGAALAWANLPLSMNLQVFVRVPRACSRWAPETVLTLTLTRKLILMRVRARWELHTRRGLGSLSTTGQGQLINWLSRGASQHCSQAQRHEIEGYR